MQRFDRRRVARILATLAVVFAIAATAGAYLDWLWWTAYTGIMLTLGAIALLLCAGLLALVARWTHRGRLGDVARGGLVVGIGLLAGQAFGPSREPLVNQFGGSMTVHLVSPVVAEATGPADCVNVASGTEFSVSGDSNMRLETPDRPFFSVYVDVGDRWRAYRDAPRKDGVLFLVSVTGQLVQADGKPEMLTYAATAASSLESTFADAGGTISFSGVGVETSTGSTGSAAPIGGSEAQLAGTVEWRCGPTG